MRGESGKKIFLDRDGVINKKRPNDYVKNWAEFEFLPGVIEALQLLKKRGYAIYVISNQAGVGRGLMNQADLAKIETKAQEFLSQHGVTVDGWYYCLHTPEFGCECRKPKPGLLLQAAREHQFRLDEAIFIGDSESDVLAGQSAGCATILIQNSETLLDAVQKII